MSEYPSDWMISSLSEIGEWKGGGTPSKANPSYWGGGIPWVSPKDMKQDLITTSEDTITESGIHESSSQLIPKDSILVVTRSGILRHTLPLAIAGTEVTINQDLKAISVKPLIDGTFVFHFLRCNSQNILDSCMKSGTTVESIDTSQFKRFPIAIPPLPEQKKIAEILSGIDMAIRRRKSAVTQIDHAIQGIRDQTQTGEGTCMRIGDLIAKISTGVSVNSENRPCKASEHGILKVSCVSKGVFYPSENKVIQGEEIERASMSIKKGMLLMSRANTPELVGACGMASNDYDNLFLPDKIWNLELLESAPCDKRWLNNALNSGIARSRVRDASTGTSNSMRNISQGNFCEIELVIPPLEIQQMQVNTIDSLQKRRKAFAVKLVRHLMLKTAISSDLLSGRKRVSI
jgi:type I restriction enzyme, S subunit